MPTLPKSRRRPWRPKREETKPQVGRKFKNKFYQKMPWRNFRAAQKVIAIEKAKKIMIELMDKKVLPLPEAFSNPQPLCEKCLKGNVLGKVYRAATVLDHIKPINPENAFDTKNGKFGEPLAAENVQWLCSRHHAQKSGAEHQFHNSKK